MATIGLVQSLLILLRIQWLLPAQVLLHKTPQTQVELQALLSAASPTPLMLRRYPLSYVLSGFYSWPNGGVSTQNSTTYWNSATAYDSVSIYTLVLTDGYYLNSRQVDDGNKRLGFSLHYTFYFTLSRRYPLSYVLSGGYRWGNGNLYSQDSIGDYWTTTVSNSDNAYNLRVNGNGALVSRDTGSKTLSFTLRRICGKTKKPPRLSKVDF